MKFFSRGEDNKHTLIVNLKGVDGPNDLIDFIKGLKPKTFIVVDPDESDYRQAFYLPKVEFNSKLLTGTEPDFKLEATGQSYSISNLADFIAYLGVAGNGGHSFGYEDSNGNKSGWDGDGSDQIVSLELYGKVFKPQDFFSPDGKDKIQKAYSQLIKAHRTSY